jgi:hypothetical protein
VLLITSLFTVSVSTLAINSRPWLRPQEYRGLSLRYILVCAGEILAYGGSANTSLPRVNTSSREWNSSRPSSRHGRGSTR